MVLSNAYNYINVLDKAADASWTRNDVLANNIANADTPGYKRKDVREENNIPNGGSDHVFQLRSDSMVFDDEALSSE